MHRTRYIDDMTSTRLYRWIDKYTVYIAELTNILKTQKIIILFYFFIFYFLYVHWLVLGQKTFFWLNFVSLFFWWFLTQTRWLLCYIDTYIIELSSYAHDRRCKFELALTHYTNNKYVLEYLFYHCRVYLRHGIGDETDMC